MLWGRASTRCSSHPLTQEILHDLHLFPPPHPAHWRQQLLLRLHLPSQLRLPVRPALRLRLPGPLSRGSPPGCFRSPRMYSAHPGFRSGRRRLCDFRRHHHRCGGGGGGDGGHRHQLHIVGIHLDLHLIAGNSAADALFQRNSLLFGLDRAAPAIRRSGEAVLVEGPLDVLQLHQAGIDNAVAALGTSLSPTQRQLLQRAGARRLILAFDGDGPGQKATARLLAELRPLAISGELELAVLPLAAAQDPDALLRQDGPAAFRQLLSGASHWLHWELEQLLAPALAAPEDLALLQRCDRQATQLLALLPAGALRRRAEQRLRQALGAVPQAMGEGLAAPAPELVPPLRLRAERRALRLYLCSPESRELLDQLELADPLCRQALSCLRQLQQRLAAAGDSQTADDPLAAIVLALTPRLDPTLAALLEDLARCGTEVRRWLQADPVPELQAVLEALEPVGEASAATVPEPSAEPEAVEPAVRTAGPGTGSQEPPGPPVPTRADPSADGSTPARPPPGVQALQPCL